LHFFLKCLSLTGGSLGGVGIAQHMGGILRRPEAGI
jgi:hypothetical protein